MKKMGAVLLAAVMLLSSGCHGIPAPETEPTAASELTTTEATEPSTAAQPTEAETIATESPTQPPSETEPTQAPETIPVELSDDAFVRVAAYIPDLRVELPYATEDNFTGIQVYDFTDGYLRYGTVKKLQVAAGNLAQRGYGLLIWDAYRPVYAQERLWEICPDPTYVSKPGTGSQSHCRGIAVDVTLYALASGELLEMPTGFDDFSALADRDYGDCTAEAAQNAALLEDAMTAAGFKPYSAEWWHYSDTDSYEVEYEFDPAEIN